MEEVLHQLDYSCISSIHLQFLTMEIKAALVSQSHLPCIVWPEKGIQYICWVNIVKIESLLWSVIEPVLGLHSGEQYVKVTAYKFDI